jgi:serine/threonine protein kinase
MFTDLAADDDLTAMPVRSRTATAAYPVAVGNNALVPGTRLGEFEIQDLIAEGGFGIVYVAYDHSLRRKVALKEYMPSALATRIGTHTVAAKSQAHSDTFATGLSSFMNEARLLALFDHPSLVKVYRVWEANGTAYMAMPLYEGVTLKAALRSARTPPDEAWLKTLLRQLLEALAALHAARCYHRDIAPDNILILRDGRALLLDFGAARQVIGDMTQALTVILKPGYAPVEQYADTASLRQGPWTDIYALAAVVHLAITGSAPTPSVARMVADAYQPLAERAKGRYGTSFLSGVDCALQVLPHARPQSVSEFAALLGIDLGGAASESGAGLASAKAKQPEAANAVAKVFAIGAIGIGIALAAGGWYALEHEADDGVATSAPELVPPIVHAPSRPPDVPLLEMLPTIVPRAAVSSAPQPATQKSFVSEPYADVAPSHPVQAPSVRANGVHIASKSKPAPQREAFRQAHATRSVEARRTAAHAPQGAANESRTPKGGVTTMECGDILHRISLGVSLPEDQQLMREKCR